MAGQFDAPPSGSVSITDAHIAGTISPTKIAGTAVITNDSRLTDARQLAAGSDKTKLDGISAGATVGADWSTNITNKPTLGDSAAKDTGTTTGTVAAGDHTHGQLHNRQHTVTDTADHTFPGGTTTFLRADGTFAAPPGGSEAFPVGAVFIAVVSTNPNTLLGYGTWSAFAAGRVLVGLNSGDTDFDVVEETGGAKTVTLATAEMPAHTHVQDAHNHTQDSHNHTQNQHTHTQDAHSHTQASTTTATGAGSNRLGTVDTSSTAENTGNAPATNQNATATNQAATATNQAATATNQNTGGGGAHNNVQPYIVVYMWKRTA